jgi:5-methylcytosine-specific restriction protein A
MRDPTPRLRGKGNLLRIARIKKREPLCRTCKAAGRVTLATEVDHIIPLFKGGPDTEDNLQPLCFECHKIKTATESAWVLKERELKGLDWII